MGSQPKLPGIGGSRADRRRRGRAERAVDTFAGQLRELEVWDPWAAAVVTAARAAGASIDRLEADPDRSEHVLATVVRAYLTALELVRPEVSGGDDGLEELAAAVRAAVGDATPPG